VSPSRQGAVLEEAIRISRAGRSNCAIRVPGSSRRADKSRAEPATLCSWRSLVSVRDVIRVGSRAVAATRCSRRLGQGGSVRTGPADRDLTPRQKAVAAPENAVLVIDSVFAFRPEYHDRWGYRILLDIDPVLSPSPASTVTQIGRARSGRKDCIGSRCEALSQLTSQR
jgi:hypothetical protein